MKNASINAQSRLPQIAVAAVACGVALWSPGSVARAQTPTEVWKSEGDGDAAFCVFKADSVRCWTRSGSKSFLCVLRGCVAIPDIRDSFRAYEAEARLRPANDTFVKFGWGECNLEWAAAVCFVGQYSATATGTLIQIGDPQNRITDY